MEISEITTIKALENFLRTPIVNEAMGYLVNLPVKFTNEGIVYKIQGLDETEQSSMGLTIALTSERHLPEESVFRIEDGQLHMEYSIATRDFHELVSDIRAVREFYKTARDYNLVAMVEHQLPSLPTITTVLKTSPVRSEEHPLVRVFERFGIDVDIQEKSKSTSSGRSSHSTMVSPYNHRGDLDSEGFSHRNRENILKLNALINICCGIDDVGHER